MNNFLRHAPLLGTALIVSIMGASTYALYYSGSGTKQLTASGFNSHLDSAYNIARAQAELPRLLSGLNLSSQAVVSESLKRLTNVAESSRLGYSKSSPQYIAWTELLSRVTAVQARISASGVPSRASGFAGLYDSIAAAALVLS